MIGSANPGIGPRRRAGSARKAPGAAPDGSFGDGPFRDGKDADALRTIGEVARALGLRQHVLRYWEEQFPTLQPLTRAGGRRYYRPEDIALLRQIDRLVHHQGYTLRGARLALTGRKSAPVAEAAPGAAESEVDIVTAMGALRAHLDGIRARLAGALAEG